MFSDLLREAVKPPPAQPTHRVAVHIPSQQDVDSDSDIEEVRYPQLYIFTACLIILFFQSSLSFTVIMLTYILYILCVTAGCS